MSLLILSHCWHKTVQATMPPPSSSLQMDQRSDFKSFHLPYVSIDHSATSVRIKRNQISTAFISLSSRQMLAMGCQYSIDYHQNKQGPVYICSCSLLLIMAV